ncbi:hypothetical protein BKA70DRAFT_1396063 [Coprinopsis sp. MPI-PUGE-AT-0042]|nr:hypothetical protein BKA70DRAFT_1396063 [Coprinopsis sp. MPI-PUGE-AT-0042]
MILDAVMGRLTAATHQSKQAIDNGHIKNATGSGIICSSCIGLTRYHGIMALDEAGLRAGTFDLGGHFGYRLRLYRDVLGFYRLAWPFTAFPRSQVFHDEQILIVGLHCDACSMASASSPALPIPLQVVPVSQLPFFFQDKMITKGVASVRSPVRNLRQHNPDIGHEHFTNAVIESFKAKYSISSEVREKHYHFWRNSTHSLCFGFHQCWRNPISKRLWRNCRLGNGLSVRRLNSPMYTLEREFPCNFSECQGVIPNGMSASQGTGFVTGYWQGLVDGGNWKVERSNWGEAPIVQGNANATTQPHGTVHRQWLPAAIGERAPAAGTHIIYGAYACELFTTHFTCDEKNLVASTVGDIPRLARDVQPQPPATISS